MPELRQASRAPTGLRRSNRRRRSRCPTRSFCKICDCPSDPSCHSPPAEPPHHPYSFTHDSLRHLARSFGTIDENDRNLLDAKSLLPRTESHLYLKGVAVRANAREINRFQDFSPKALEPAGRVEDRNAGHLPRVNVRRVAQEKAAHRP